MLGDKLSIDLDGSGASCETEHACLALGLFCDDEVGDLVGDPGRGDFGVGEDANRYFFLGWSRRVGLRMDL